MRVAGDRPREHGRGLRGPVALRRHLLPHRGEVEDLVLAVRVQQREVVLRGQRLRHPPNDPSLQLPAPGAPSP